jgi:hypothetical protein
LKTSFAGALDAAHTLAHLDDLARNLWQAYGAGNLQDAEAENLAARIEDRRREIRPQDRTAVRAPHVPRIDASFFPAKRRYPVSPDRYASQQRRRRLAASGPMPPNLACHFTVGQQAVLRIVANEVREKGSCALSIGEIAARAGVGVTTARDAIRAAALDGLVVIEERRQHRAPNLPNRVRVISREWLNWLKRGDRGGGSKVSESTNNKDSKHPVENSVCGQKAGSASLNSKLKDRGGGRKEK